MNSMSIWHWLVLLIPVLLMALLYILPAIVAFRRRHHNRAAILALNLLLGWTGLGWIAALVWSLTETRGGRPHLTR